jgi:ATP-binding cassette subfamily F protein uup
MALISLHNLTWGFGGQALLENIDFAIESGERVCLVGRNGVGKSSLLRLLDGRLTPDSGEIRRQKGVSVAAMEQEVPAGFDGTVFDVVAQGLARGDESGWERRKPVETILSRTSLDPALRFADLSAGMKRRTLFARALVGEPDLLMLDEPTNHLDIGTIEWMESFLLRYVKTLLFVTHDRAFLKKVATRVVELDRGRLTSYACDYETYLVRRDTALAVEQTQQRQFDKKLSQEEAWIRQGIKARRTRNEGRVRALLTLREQARQRRSRMGQARLQVQEAERSGKLVIQAMNLNLSLGEWPIVRDFSTTILRGDKVGIIGPNGAGKTTLLNLLLGHIAPDSGGIRHGTHLQVAYYDQLRAQLDDDRSVADNIAEGNDFLTFNDQKRHVISYLQDFLFSPDRCRTPVRVLSGGERNRLMLAKLFTRPANVLVLDEPTNDLDAETLELLEDLLLDYAGTVLLVSHDRAFLNHVVTSTLVFEGEGRVVEYAGGYDDWLLQRPAPADAVVAEKPEPAKPRPAAAAPKPKKLGYMQARELEALPGRIEALEIEQQQIHDAMADPLFYKKDKFETAALRERLAQVEREIAAAYRQWEELENSA